MRFFRVVSWSIFRARRSLSAVSSSTELLAVLTSSPSFLRRSTTSWLDRPRSRASWKTLTFPIRLPSPGRTLGCRGLHGARLLGLRPCRLFGSLLRLFGGPLRFFGGPLGRLLGSDPLGLDP